MDPITQQTVLACAGAAGGASDATYVDDVFSTFLYDGSESAQTITNGIDLSGEGGLVWIKQRTPSANDHALMSSDNSFQGWLSTNDNDARTADGTQYVTANSNGFSINNGGVFFNDGTEDYVSWTFRSCPGFFDVVTYTGNGTAGRTISHNLGSVPGFVIVKTISHAAGWYCYHRSVGNDRYVQLGSNQAQSNSGFAIWNSTDPTSTEFTLGPSGWNVNESGKSYVAYFFAHNDQSFGTDSDESIIKCDVYTSNNSSSGLEVNVGFEPQWLLIKNIETGGDGYDWTLHDNMRDRTIYPNLNYVDSNSRQIIFRPNGFKILNKDSNVNDGGDKYIYIAIRRPNKPPETGTDVFKAVTYSGQSSAQTITGVGFAPDYMWSKDRSQGNNGWHHDRLRGVKSLDSSGSGAEQDRSSYVDELGQDGIKFVSGNFDLNRNNSNHVAHFYKRAPGFFDVVSFVGSSPSSQNVSHNLGVVPEMMILKNRQSNFDWNVYHASLGNSKALVLNDNSTGHSSTAAWNTTTPTASVFSVGDNSYTNQGSQEYIAYLFASLDGISKVGSYTGAGSGNSVDVDCGFTAGARFVVIKDTEAAGDWYVYDSARGIVSGNDPILFFNSTTQEQTGADDIDPLNAGFKVVSNNSGLNTSGRTYIYLAIA